MKAKLSFDDKGKFYGTQKEYYANGNMKYRVSMEDGRAKKGRIYESDGTDRKMNDQDFAKLGF
jgi:antitoxin component YwqK of YwqJK toxin-antitoxin module